MRWLYRSDGSSDGPSQLYIFVTSAEPDPYINVLVHAIRKYSLVQIYFVSVVEHGYTEENDAEDARLRTIVSNVDNLFEDLSQGNYWKERAGERDSVAIDPTSTEMYRSCFAEWERIPSTTFVIKWQELDQKLRGFAADGRGMFDVTALKKNLLVDISVLLVSRGCTRIFEFEILRRPRFYDQRDLIHELKEPDRTTKGDYTYRNLTESAHLKSAVKRMIAGWLYPLVRRD